MLLRDLKTPEVSPYSHKSGLEKRLALPHILLHLTPLTCSDPLSATNARGDQGCCVMCGCLSSVRVGDGARSGEWGLEAPKRNSHVVGAHPHRLAISKSTGLLQITYRKSEAQVKFL